MKLVKKLEEANCVTHSGTMHADDVFATAFLDKYLENIKVFRTTNIDPDKNKDKIVYDVGRGAFDHHQVDARIRENGIKYCSLGLLWDSFGRKYLEKRNVKNIEDVFLEIDKDLIEQIDAIDNGEFPKIEANYKLKSISDVIKLFNPSFKSDENENDQFIKAIELAKVIFEEVILNAIGKVTAKEIVNSKIKETDKDYIILDEYMPYEETIILNEEANNICFCIFPSNRGGYTLKTIPKSFEDRTARCEIPEEWAGKSDEELQEVSNIKDLTFCHVGRFIISGKTKESIVEATEKMIELNKLKNIER